MCNGDEYIYIYKGRRRNIWGGENIYGEMMI